MMPNGRRDWGLGPALTPPARPGLALVVYRWRYELAIVGIMTGGFAALVYWAGVLLTIVVLAGLTIVAGVAATQPEVRRFVAARAWCIITPHRVRTCFAQAWVINRSGQTPAVRYAVPMSFGERVVVWCRAGTSVEDIEPLCELLAAACWAVDAVVGRNSSFAHLVYIDVIRR